MSYDAWGVPSGDLALANYTGHDWDSVLRVYFAQARVYDAGGRRFLAVDIIAGTAVMPGTLNRYDYCRSNPMVFVDPDGRVEVTIGGITLRVVENKGVLYADPHDLLRVYGIDHDFDDLTGDYSGAFRYTDKNGVEYYGQITRNFKNSTVSTTVSQFYDSAPMYQSPTATTYNGTMYLNMISVNYFAQIMCDMGAGKTINYSMAMSPQGEKMLKHIELPYNSTYKYLFKHENGRPVGIYPYWVGEGGVTLGYGHYIGRDEIVGSKKDPYEVAVAEEFGLYNRNNPMDTSNFEVYHNNMPKIITTNTYVTLARANQLLRDEVIFHAGKINSYLSDNQIALSQWEFDALVTYRFLKGSLGDTITSLLKKPGERDRVAWRTAFGVKASSGNAQYQGGWDERADKMLKLFFDGKYTYNASEVLN